ncbi:uncharacterized protein LOC117649906 [Thrips palmi]|uniref:Regulatory protein zeste n=1 Tax=Thrips palmi TaxID=161013 RepID=A0A6P8ZUK7_THRPL|nr:uncharacterized protein LOC117649906 [Thrips palmi]
MARPSPQQWTALLGLIANDAELVHGEFKGPLGVVRVRRRWDEIAQILNAMPNAPVQRDGEKWKSTWISLRGRAREAFRLLAKYRAGTGGGPLAEFVGLGLSPLYEQVLSMTGTRAAVGSNCPNPLQIQLNIAAAAQQNVVHLVLGEEGTCW